MIVVLAVFVIGCGNEDVNPDTSAPYVIDGTVKDYDLTETIKVINNEGYGKLYAVSCMDSVLVTFDFKSELDVNASIQTTTDSVTEYSFNGSDETLKVAYTPKQDAYVMFIATNYAPQSRIEEEVKALPVCSN